MWQWCWWHRYYWWLAVGDRTGHQHIWLPTSMLFILSIFYHQNIIKVSFYANVLALCIALITIGALIWSIFGSKSHAAYKPANGHTRTRIRKSCLFMIIFLSFISSFAISVIALSYSFNLWSLKYIVSKSGKWRG